MGLIVTLILGIFILIGVLVIKITKNSKVVEQLSISIALGTMSTLVITELLPEVFETFKTDNILNLYQNMIMNIVYLMNVQKKI